MENFDIVKIFEYLPNVLEQLTTREQIIGGSLFLVPIVLYFGLRGMQQPWRGLLATAVLFGVLFFLYTMLAPQAVQLAEENPGHVALDTEAIAAATAERPPTTGQAAPTVITPPPSPPDHEGMLFPDSDTRLLTAQDLDQLEPAALSIARNEIYARKGRFFRSADLAAHFTQFDWYEPFTWTPELNDVEKQNIAIVQSFEDQS